MLIGFKLRNFRSYFAEQTFSFAVGFSETQSHYSAIRTGVRSVPQLSKAAILFGANGSGKTNLIAALETLRDLVLHSTEYDARRFAQRYTPCRFHCSGDQPTVFEIEVLLDRVRYRYIVAYNASHVSYEKLLVYQTGKAQRWFERQYDPSATQETWAPFATSFHGPREMWRKATRPAALFLTTAAQLKSWQLRPLQQWFEQCVDIMPPAKSTSLSSVASLLGEAKFKLKLLRCLNSVDIDVTDLRVRDTSPSCATQDYQRRATDGPTVEFLHAHAGSEPVWIRMDQESSGTIRLLGLFGPLLRAMEDHKILVIDDFDRNLHPLIARHLVELINNPVGTQSQLLLVSHNTALMDLAIFRREQIWLAEADEARGSTLHTVMQSGARRQEQVDKGYLRGRYGAVPEIAPVGAS